MMSTLILSLEEILPAVILVMYIATHLGTGHTAGPTVEHLLRFIGPTVIEHCGQDNTETPRSSLRPSRTERSEDGG
jgi:hypothetical protein